MGYGFKIPAYRVGGPKKSWGIRGYGLYPLWVMRGSTEFDCKWSSAGLRRHPIGG